MNQSYYDLASQVGTLIGSQGDALVYGGTCEGMMNSVASAVRMEGGKVVGIVNQLFIDRQIVDSKADELILVESLSERKSKMIECSDVVVVLPGGVGTLDEFFEVLSLRLLSCTSQPIVLLNWNSFFGSLVEQLRLMVREGFIELELWNALTIVESIEGVENFLKELRENNKMNPYHKPSAKVRQF